MRRPTPRQAIDQWPGMLQLTLNQPTDLHLQKLCSLLDIVDAWVVKGWDSHPDRRRTLSMLRSEAAEANRAVNAEMRSQKAQRGATANAARKAKVS